MINGVSVLSLVEFANVWFKDNAYHCPVGEYGDLLRGVVSGQYVVSGASFGKNSTFSLTRLLDQII